MNKEILIAFEWLLHCPDDLIDLFVQLLHDQPQDLEPAYIFAWNAIEALALD